MKMLYILNTTSRVGSFSESSQMAALNLGIEFHIAGNWTGYKNKAEVKQDEKKYGIKIHQVDFIRSPYDLRNVKAYKQICEIIKKEKIDVIHCNTPIGGVIGRLAGNKCGVKEIIYEAHGFHFYQGASLLNWLIYYPVEKGLAHLTDALITINSEDYKLAQSRFHLRKHGKVYYVPGVGIDTKDYKNDESYNRKLIRDSLGFKETDIVCISAGDLIPRKNYETAIKSISRCNDSRIHYIICGQGPELEKLKKITSSLNLEKQVHFWGYRTDLKKLYHASDIFLITTLQEGIPRSMMEAMASGLPCIASEIRGNIDLLENERGGYLVPVTDIKGIAEKIEILASNENLRLDMGNANLDRIQSFNINTIERLTEKIYTTELIGGGQQGN